MKLLEVVELIMTEEIRKLKYGAYSLTLNMDSRGRNKSKRNNQGGRFQQFTESEK